MARAPATGPSPAMGMKMAMARMSLREGADAVEDLAHDVRDEAARYVLGAQEAERDRQGGPDDGAHPGHLERLDHGVHGVVEECPIRPAVEEHLGEHGGDAPRQGQDVRSIDVEAEQAGQEEG